MIPSAALPHQGVLDRPENDEAARRRQVVGVLDGKGKAETVAQVFAQEARERAVALRWGAGKQEPSFLREDQRSTGQLHLLRVREHRRELGGPALARAVRLGSLGWSEVRARVSLLGVRHSTGGQECGSELQGLAPAQWQAEAVRRTGLILFLRVRSQVRSASSHSTPPHGHMLPQKRRRGELWGVPFACIMRSGEQAYSGARLSYPLRSTLDRMLHLFQ